MSHPLPTAPTVDVLSAFRRPVWIYNLDGHRIEGASPAALSLWRAESSEVLRTRALGPLTPGAAARLEETWRLLLRGEAIFETWTLYPGGHPTPVRCTFAPMRNEADERLLLIEAEPFTTEVPDEARAVEALRHDPAPVLLFSLPEGALILANPAARVALGHLGRLDALFVDPAAAQRLRNELPWREVLWGEDLIHAADGPRTAAWRAARGVDPALGGDMVALTLLDVTDARAEAQARIKALSRAVDGTHDGIALTDAQGRFTFMNPAHLHMFGYTSEAEVVGRPWTILYSEAEGQRFLTEVFPLLTSPGAHWRGKADGLHVDGRVVEQEVSLTIQDDGGIICVTRDIGARLRAETQRRRLEIEVAQAHKMETVGQFVGGLVHDLNNLLAAMLATSSGIAAQSEAPDRVRAGCERIDRVGVQAARMVRRMLDFVRYEDAPPVVVDLRALLIRATDLLRALLPKRVVLEVAPGDRVLRALVKEDRIVQVLLNLAANARDAMSEGGHLRIRLAEAGPPVPERCGRGVHPAGHAAEIVVEDDGPGVAEEALPRLFEPFFTTKPAGQGTGIGLSTSAGLVAEAGGRIEVWNSGRGACFRLVLPAQATLGMARVMVTHPDPELADLIARVLEREGYAIEVAPTAHQAMEALRRAPAEYRLLLADADAPGLDARAWVSELGAPEAPVPVLLTTRGSLAPVDLPPGARALRTPFSTSALVGAVAECMGTP